MLRSVRERAVELPPIQRDTLDAAFGLAPEPCRIAMAALDLVSDVATDVPVLHVVDDAHWLDRLRSRFSRMTSSKNTRPVSGRSSTWVRENSACRIEMS
jgi:hypothetical protein